MKRRITIWMLCLVAFIIWTGLVYAQTIKPGAMKEIRVMQNGWSLELSFLYNHR
jgi:hypothetical protein